MATIAITDASFETDVLKSSTPVLVDFWAEWCGPCKAIGPALEEISEEFAGRVTVAKLNIDDNPDVPTKIGVRGIPFLMVFKDGQAIATHQGAMARSKIADWLNAAL